MIEEVKCVFCKDGVCEATTCYSDTQCGARDPLGHPIYKWRKPKSYCGYQPTGTPSGCVMGFCETCNFQPVVSPDRVEPKPDRTKLSEWGSPGGLPKGWRGRIMKGLKKQEGIK